MAPMGSPARKTSRQPPPPGCGSSTCAPARTHVSAPLIAACDDTIQYPSGRPERDVAAWVTLLGDAAHLMPPVGQGANMALLDGALLGLALAAHPNDFSTAVSEYEREMFERTGAAARQSAHMQQLLASPDASQKLLTFPSPD